MFIKLLFFIVIIMTISASVIFITDVKKIIPVPPETEENSAEEFPENKTEETEPLTAKKLSADIFTIFAALLGISDINGLIDTGMFHGAFILMGTVLLLEKACNYIRSRKNSRTLKFFGKILLIVSVLELTVFQFPSYRIFFGDYEKQHLSISDGTVINAITEKKTGNIIVKGQNTATVLFENINQKVGTIKINVKSSSFEELIVNINATDDTSALYRTSIIWTKVLPANSGTEYTTVLLSGKVGALQFNFSGIHNYDLFTISGIELNTPIPFEVSVLRMALIIIISTLAWAVIFSGLLNRSYEKNSALCEISAIVVTVFAVLIAYGMTCEKIPYDSGNYFLQKEGNQISEELVLAFENGQISLIDEPEKELLELKDPYDTYLRESTVPDYKWDHVFYKGKYYSYYGIAPVILLFLPYHLITGSFFPTDIAVLIFSALGLVFLAKTYNAIIKRWFRRIPSGCYIAGLVILLTVCGIWYCVGRPLFYEISISSGFAFTALGAYFLISSNVIGGGEISLAKIPFASLFLAIAVLCRPTLAVYSVCACVYYAIGFGNSAKIHYPDGSIKTVKSRKIKYILGALIPFVVLGLVQMWYNYVRFDSPLDFGIKYSLTINDFIDSEYHTLFVLIGMFAYIFAFPSVKPDYPYVETPFTYFDANGYYFKDLGQTSGILFLALPVFAYLLGGKALRKLPDRRTKIKYSVITLLPCVIMPLLIMFSIWESGYAVRYTADFSWQILIGAYVILFFLYQNTANITLKKLFRYFMAFSMTAALIINIPQIFDFSFPEYDYPVIVSKFSELISFWR
ncbi:MAG: hypothetical protein K2K14_06395 [Ruminococcus sp.]|nr:hypothetical protein [Ruminococcus sp.]